MPRGTGREAAVLGMVLVALCGCSRPQWARGAKAPEPPAAPVAAAPAAAPVTAVPGMAGWAVAMLGKNPRTLFPRNGVCRGNTDGHGPLEGTPGEAVFGWGWDFAAKTRVERVVLVDVNYVIVGAGEGGRARPDVPKAYPQEVHDGATGWIALTSLTKGPVDAFGVTGGGTAICPLGHVEF